MCLIFVIFVVGVENTMLMFQIEKGKDVKMDFGEGMFLIKRITKASPKPQYYFSHPKQDGTWTTDGVSFFFFKVFQGFLNFHF